MNASHVFYPAPMGVALFGRDGRLLLHTPGLAALLGVQSAVVTQGVRLEDLLALICAGWLIPDGTKATNLPTPIRCRNPQGRIVDIAFEALPHDRICVTVSDVTDARAAEDELRRARIAAEVANQAKSRFLATMSHELRTPLNAIIGFSDALEREAGHADGPPIDRAQVLEFAGAINEAGQHLLTLINTILDVARIESGRFDLAADLIEIDHLVGSCLRATRATADAAEVALEVDLPTPLPRLRGDERRLRQVMSHLLGNAVKFTHAGGRILVHGEQAPDGDMLLHVTDNGIGIPDADLERVFEPFSQLDAGLARKAPGAGLGLYFCRALVQGHGGALTLHSQPGYGTTATIRLPGERLVEPTPSLELIQESP